MNVDIELRQNQLKDLQSYLNDVDTEVTIILQNLQWDRKHFTEDKPMVACQYDSSHTVPPDKLVEHENKCFLKSQGNAEVDRLLPSPFDPNATTLVKLDASNIAEIIHNASLKQPMPKAVLIGSFGCERDPFVKSGYSGPPPLTLERLQATYRPHERRAIHDAVVEQVPSCHDLSDLTLLSSKDDVGNESKPKSKEEILAELRNMRRRRTKYRVAAKTRNYSDVLRDVITTQMELYHQAHNIKNPMHKNSDLDLLSNAKDELPKASDTDGRFNEKSKRRNFNKDEQSSTFTTRKDNTLGHSKNSVEYEIKKRRNNDAEHPYNSKKYSQTKELHDSVPSKTAQYEGHKHHDSNLKIQDYTYTDFTKPKRKRDKDGDHYERSKRYREKEYDHGRKEYTSSTTKDISKDNYYISRSKEKHRDYDRHQSDRSREKHDHYRNKKSSSKRKSHVDREKIYKHNHQQIQKIKKEKHDNYDDESNSSYDNDTEYSEITSRSYETYSNVNKVKIEKKVYVKNREHNASRHSDSIKTETNTKNRKD